MKKILLVLLTCLLFVSCSKNKMGVPANLSAIDDSLISGEWAVITSPYTAFRAEPTLESKIIAHSRRGDVFLVEGRFIQKQEDSSNLIWYKFTDGWLMETDLSVYTNKLQAENAASRL